MIGLNFSLQELLEKFEEVFLDLLLDCFELTGLDHKGSQVPNASVNRQFLIGLLVIISGFLGINQ